MKADQKTYACTSMNEEKKQEELFFGPRAKA